MRFPHPWCPRRKSWLPLLPLALVASCGSSSEPDPQAPDVPSAPAELPEVVPGQRFTDVTLAAGIEQRHALPTEELTNIVDSLGGGAAFCDLDEDGWLDLVVLGGARSPRATDASPPDAGLRVYRNRGDGRFEDVTRRAGFSPADSGVAIAVADVDGDGDRDVFVADRGPNRLYENQGGFRFEEVGRAAGLDDARFAAGAVFFDMDGDGDVDLYVTNYLEYDPSEDDYYAPTGFPGPLAYEAQADALYENLGGGRFADVSQAAGVAALSGRGMSVAASDFDGDGDVDLFVANDATENFLLVNDGHGRFEEQGMRWGVALSGSGERTSAMAADVGDVDGDGLLDLSVSDTSFGALYCRRGERAFRDQAMPSGLGVASGQYVSWGQNLFDCDDDGDLDVFVVNGGLHHLVGWEDLLIENDGAGRFVDVSSEAGPWFAERHIGRSSIVGDYDGDGDLDLFVTNLQGRPALLRNDRAPDNSWIAFDLVGAFHRDAFGAVVELVAGTRRQVAALRCPTGYLGQSDPRLHFGLGPGVEEVERVTITWPDGSVQELRELPARRLHRIARVRE